MCATMGAMTTRPYRMKKRAEQQEQTRRRIVEAAVELHGEVGPARTTVSAVAARAGVERHTYYRHFPDEFELTMACSGHFYEVNPMPDPQEWRAIEDPEERLTRALGELYAYYERHEALLANVVRDAETHEPTRNVTVTRLGPIMQAMRDALADGLASGRGKRRVLAAIDLALDFRTWRTLVRTSGLRQGEAAKLMARTVACAGQAA
jgi:AcrR family transcriptional regulator